MIANKTSPEPLSGNGGHTMKAFLTKLSALLAVVVLLASPSPAAAAGKRVIITFKSKASLAARTKALTAMGAKALSNIASNGNGDNEFVAIVAELGPQAAPSTSRLPNRSGKSNMSLIPDVSKEDILSVEADYKVKWIEAAPSFQASQLPSLGSFMGGLPKFTPTGVKMPASSRPELTWGIDAVHAPAAWDTTEGAGVRVAIIDTGINIKHKDLQGKVDGGYDAISKSEQADAYQDQNGHGTHVAGTVGALRDGKGVVGVAPKARLYAVRVLDADGSGSLSDVIDGIIWCANNGIQVANMSLGSSQPSDTMRRALAYAKSRGVVVVAAAGNSGGAVGYPGAYPEVIGVAASDSDGKLASFSSRGPEVDFIAPGVYVVSTAMDGGYANFSGTSMAAPHMAGIVALAVSQGWVGLDGPDGVMAQLKKAAKPLPGLTAEQQGAGMVDAGKLVR